MKWILKVEICLCVRLDFGFNFGFFLCVFSGLFHCRFRSFYFGVATICVACSKEGHTYVCFLLCLGDFAGCHNAAVILGRELFAPAKRITSHCGRCRMRSRSRSRSRRRRKCHRNPKSFSPKTKAKSVNCSQGYLSAYPSFLVGEEEP